MPDLAMRNDSMVMTAQQLPDASTTTKTPDSREKKQSLDYVLRSGLAGGVAGCAAKTLIAPLDRVKILFQASNPQFLKYTGSWVGVAHAVKDIQRQDGFWGLYRGHSATLLRIFPYAAIKFVAYEQIRAIAIPSKEYETPVRRFLSGSLAGVASVFFTYPLEVIRVRLAFETRKDHRLTLTGICKKIYHEGGVHAPAQGVTAPLSGIKNFYRGFLPTVLGMLPYAGVSFLSHDMMGDWLRNSSISKYTTVHAPLPIASSDNLEAREKKVVLKVWAELLTGGFAGLCSQTASYPLEIVRRRMQVGGAIGDGQFLRVGETVRAIWRTSGFRGFFVGLSIGYVKIIPMTATAFFVYERSKLLLGI
ncbi:mitochondrial carrier domain-containing protein [Peziza echinospora]|nr:mitochondrial carrier domain-containing protein [Peziza echinospora]